LITEVSSFLFSYLYTPTSRS